MVAFVLMLLQVACGGSRSENPIHAPLRFLARHQNPDGSWGSAPEHCRCVPGFVVDRPVHLTVDPGVEREFQVFLKQLEDDEIIAREQAVHAILRLGVQAVPLLQRQSGHGILDVRDRCRDALRRLYASDAEVRMLLRGDGDLRATSLALLAFMGSGYTTFSRDELYEPTGFAKYEVGTLIKRALVWLLSKQTDEGSFSADPLANVMPALAICEAYGMTARQVLREPAERAVASVKASASTDPRFLFWKGLLLHSADLSEVPYRREGERGEAALLLSKEASPLGRFGSLLLRKLDRDPTVRLQEQISDLNWDELTPEDFWIATSAGFRIWGRKSEDWRTWRAAMPVQVQQRPRDHRC